MNLYCIAFGGLFGMMGISFLRGVPPRWLNLWGNTLPEEKAQINVNALYRHMAAVFFGATVLFIISGVSPDFLDRFFIWGILTWFVLTGLDVAYISKNKKFITPTK